MPWTDNALTRDRNGYASPPHESNGISPDEVPAKRRHLPWQVFVILGAWIIAFGAIPALASGRREPLLFLAAIIIVAVMLSVRAAKRWPREPEPPNRFARYYSAVGSVVQIAVVLILLLLTLLFGAWVFLFSPGPLSWLLWTAIVSLTVLLLLDLHEWLQPKKEL